MPPRTWQFRIEDMLEAIATIAGYTHGLTFEEFCADQMRLDAVQHQLMVLGEAATRVLPAVCARARGCPLERHPRDAQLGCT